MSDIAIRVEHLSKRYKLGEREPYKTLRDTISRVWKVPFGWVRTNQQQASGNGLGYFWALDDVSFEIKQGEAVGIIGRNGAGKSTLLKILSRITKPTRGRAEIYGRVGSLLEVGTGFHPELTGRENIYLNGAILGMKRPEIQRKFDEIVAFAEIEEFLDTPVKRYSSGMYVRLAFAVAAHLEPEILVVDEVLAVGDAEFQKKCLGKMGDVTGKGRTVLLVSHNMKSVSELCAQSILLSEGRIREVGETSKAIDSYLKSKVSHKGRIYASDVFERKYVGPHEIISVWLEDGNGNEKYQFNHYEDVVFCLKIKSYSKSVVIGVTVKDFYNQSLIFLSNINDKCTLLTNSEESIVKIKLERILLRGGDYLVTFVLNDGANVFCDAWRDVITMSISDINLGIYLPLSPIKFQAQWSISSIDLT